MPRWSSQGEGAAAPTLAGRAEIHTPGCGATRPGGRPKEIWLCGSSEGPRTTASREAPSRNGRGRQGGSPGELRPSQRPYRGPRSGACRPSKTGRQRTERQRPRRRPRGWAHGPTGAAERPGDPHPATPQPRPDGTSKRCTRRPIQPGQGPKGPRRAPRRTPKDPTLPTRMALPGRGTWMATPREGKQACRPHRRPQRPHHRRQPRPGPGHKARHR